jgi:hypothetical protein
MLRYLGPQVLDADVLEVVAPVHLVWILQHRRLIRLHREGQPRHVVDHSWVLDTAVGVRKYVGLESHLRF